MKRSSFYNVAQEVNEIDISQECNKEHSSYPHLPLFVESDGLLQQLEDLGVAIQETKFPGDDLEEYTEPQSRGT